MEFQKRKREGDGGSNTKRGKAEENGNGVAVPADEEVDEFFAILKRIQVAVKYFRDREGGGRQAPSSSLKFEREDFVTVKKESENQSVGFDLNSDPVFDVSDHGK